MVFGNPDTRDFVAAARAGDFATAKAIFDRQPDWDHRAMLVWLIKDSGRPAYINDWVEQFPEDPLALIVSGNHAVIWAWEARSRARAEHVSAVQFEEFHNRLRLAEEILAKAAVADDTSPLPWCAMLNSGRGLQISREEIDFRMQSMLRRDPLLDGHMNYLQFICDKWFGSHDEMWAFAEGVSNGSPAGSPLHSLVAIAAIEHHIEMLGGSRRRKALKKDGRLNTLHQAAERSIFDPSFDRTSPSGIQAMTSFLTAYDNFGMKDQIKRLVPMMEYASEWPLVYLYGDSDIDKAFANLKIGYS